MAVVWSILCCMADKLENPRVNIRTSPEIIDFLDQLAEIGIHGKTRSEVAKTLISNEVERLIREGMISLPRNKELT